MAYQFNLCRFVVHVAPMLRRWMSGSTANVAVLHHVAGLWLVSKQLVLQEFREIDDGWVEKSLNLS